MANDNVDFESRLNLLEAKVTILEGTLIRNSKNTIRRKREYTSEEKTNIRARLVAGQEAARKRREEVDTKIIDKTDSGKIKKIKNQNEPAN
jgi:hypothetical protein